MHFKGSVGETGFVWNSKYYPYQQGYHIVKKNKPYIFD